MRQAPVRTSTLMIIGSFPLSFEDILGATTLATMTTSATISSHSSSATEFGFTQLGGSAIGQKSDIRYVGVHLPLCKLATGSPGLG
jgi:hypothetical protein